MWDKIKKAVNTTLGKDDFQPLDKILDYEEYLKLYMSALSEQMVKKQNSEILADCEGQKIYRSVYNDNNYRWKSYATNAKLFLYAPWVEEIQSGETMRTILPPKLKKIGSDALYENYLGIRIPPSVEEIAEDAMRRVGTSKVFIYNKEGAIPNAPWGHPYPQNIIYMM